MLAYGRQGGGTAEILRLRSQNDIAAIQSLRRGETFRSFSKSKKNILRLRYVTTLKHKENRILKTIKNLHLGIFKAFRPKMPHSNL